MSISLTIRNISPLLSFSNKQKITLNRNNETLVIGMPDNLIPSSENQMGFVYTNQTTGNPRIPGMPSIFRNSIFRNAQENSIAKYVVASPANQGTYDLRGENVATTIEVGSLSRNASKPRESTVYADANDKIALGEGTTIGEMKQNDDGTVSIQFVNTRAGKDISNIVKVVATKEDMLKILENSEGLPEVLAAAKDKLKAAGLNTEALVEKSGEETGKVSPDVAAWALNSRATLYGENHEKNEKFINYKKELERGGYTVTKGTDGKYKVTKKQPKPHLKTSVKSDSRIIGL
jgi:hypothetical protein